MKWGPCAYLSPNATLAEIARYAQALNDRLFHALDGNVGVNNLDETEFGPEFDFTADPSPNPQGGPGRKVHIPLLNPLGGGPLIRPKGTDFANAYESSGVEIFVDATDTTDGKVCIGDLNDPALQQIISLDPDQYTAAAPGGTLKTPLGALTLDTGGAFDVIAQRNGTEHFRLDGNIKASKQIYWATGLGAITHALGPGDQDFTIANTPPASGNAGQKTVLAAAAGNGTNKAGGDLELRGGASTGSANGPSIVFKGNPAGGGGSSVNTLCELARLSSLSGFVFSDHNSGAGPETSAVVGPTDANMTFKAGTANQATTTTAGRSTTIQSSSAVAGSSVDGAAAGGTITLTAGDAARRNSGSAAGGSISLTPGLAIGGGTEGAVNVANRSTALLGFFATSAAARQSSAALTNNVTSGGTTDVVDDISSSGATFANLTSTRNAVYQLARKVKEIGDALRLHGLLA